MLKQRIQQVKDWIHAIFHLGQHKWVEDADYVDGLKWRYCEREGCFCMQIKKQGTGVWLGREEALRLLDNDT